MSIVELIEFCEQIVRKCGFAKDLQLNFIQLCAGKKKMEAMWKTKPAKKPKATKALPSTEAKIMMKISIRKLNEHLKKKTCPKT